MDTFSEDLVKFLARLPPPPSFVQDQTIEIRATLDQDDEDADTEDCQILQTSTRSLTGDYARAYQEDPVIMAAAAAAAAVKFRSNYLPPIGVFWDIENCQVPKGRSAMAVTRVIRDKFFNGYKEVEFIVVCDVQKENKQIIQELNDAQVDLIHVSSTSKNAADEKLRQSIRRFADTHGSPAAIILISGDIDFAADLSDLRHRKKIHVILLHKENTSEALILCADEHYDFTKLLEPLPARTPSKMAESYDLLVYNLPDDKDVIGIKRRLKQLSNNCGGRVVQVRSNAAVLRFCSKESANRAQKRMHGKYIYDSKIVVKFLKENFNLKNQDNSGIRDSTASESEAVSENTNEMFGVASSLLAARSLPGTPHYPTMSPVVGNHSSWNGMHCGPQGGLAPPMYIRSYGPNDSCHRAYTDHMRSQSPQMWQMSNPQSQQNRFWDERYKAQDYGRSDVSNFRAVKGPSFMRGPFTQPQEWNQSRLSWPAPNSHNGPAYNQTHKRRSPSPMYATTNPDANHWNGQVTQGTVNARRIDRTPSPYDLALMPSAAQRNERVSPYRQSDAENEEVENFFSPINTRNSNGTCSGQQPIQLQVTNLDQNIDPKDMKRILSSVFMEHVMVLQVSIFVHSDGNYVANVKVPSLLDAQYAISQLHRRKIGYKRILISYAHTNGPNPQIVRSQIVMLLQEVPEHKLPLFKFREMYESRFMISISISELYKMKDVCIISDEPNGRMVSLNPDHRNTPSPCLNSTLDGQSLELPYCTIHAQKPWTDKGWAEQEMASLPNIKMSLKLLNERVHKLLSTHSGNLPLPTFPSCYEAEFNEPLPIQENGVPLEHLVSCLSTVELKQGNGCVKHIVWSTNKNHDDSHDENKCLNSPLANQLALFSRELVDLLKTAPHCQLSFNRFIPAYHHHFGRQCRVADYGFTKLIDLLEALSHTVQVMGEGNKRVVTLSHRAQVRRFTSDLLRVLKAQASKQVTLSEFPNSYVRVIGRPWDAADYGVCELDDILSEVSENTVVVTTCKSADDRMIAIPKREQTPEEIERTRQFASEVIELLKHAPQQRMLFNKFVPSYHHHFGHQCRVSDYGFTKLIELFEAIPDIVIIEEVNGGERQISLTEKEAIRVLGEQVTKLIQHFGTVSGQLNLTNVAQLFLQKYGYALRPEHFNCSSVLQLIEKLEGAVKIVKTRNGLSIASVDKSHIQHLGLECRRVLMDALNYCYPIGKFEDIYQQLYNKPCLIEKYAQSLECFVRIFVMNNEKFVELTPLQRFACNAQRVLMKQNGKMSLGQFERAYLKVVGLACRAAQYGYPTLYALLRAIPCTVIIKDTNRRKTVIQLNKKLAAVGLLPSSYALSASPIQDTDSSTESIESESFSSLVQNNQLNVSAATEKSKWVNMPQQSVWSAQAVSSTSQNSQNWPSSDNRGNSFFGNMEKVSPTFPRPPLKPDSPENGEKDRWQSSIWSTPPKMNLHLDTSFTKVDVPPMSLSPLKKLTSDELSKLISPAKNILSATANPLYPATSPFFSSEVASAVVAPHPSELPLPTMSFTPKKTNTKNETRQASSINKADFHVSPISSKKDKTDNGIIDRINDATPNKRLFFGKCRLAAQFNQPPHDS